MYPVNLLLFFVGFTFSAASQAKWLCEGLLAKSTDLPVTSEPGNETHLSNLRQNGHSLIKTNLNVSDSELKSWLLQHPALLTPEAVHRTKQLNFTLKNNWQLDRDDGWSQELPEEQIVSPEVKAFGLRLGNSLRELINSKLENESVDFTQFDIQWTTPDIETNLDDHKYAQVSKQKASAHAYINAVLQLRGPGLLYWQDSTQLEIAPKQISPGDILILTGMGRAIHLENLNLATVFSPAPIAKDQSFLQFTFRFRPANFNGTAMVRKLITLPRAPITRTGQVATQTESKP